MQEIVGRVVGNHELAERLGGGAMGDVYRGRHVGLELDRAVKILAPDLARDPTYVSLFAREARVAAGLRHPNIVQIFDVGTDQGLHYIAMELLEGQSLNRVLAQRRAFRPEEALPLLEQLGAALDYAHERGVIHRDIKPSNVMLGSDGHLTLVDFGIARASESTGMTQTRTSGTPYYMAPEVWRGEGGTRGADLYALGVLVYELLVGHVPFRGPTHVAVMHAHIYEPPPAPRSLGVTLPSAIEAVLLRQLAKDPEARYPSAGALVAALKRAAELGDRVQAARGALATGDFARASAAIGELATEAPDDPDVRALRADLAVASHRAGLLDGTRPLTPDETTILHDTGGRRSDGGADTEGGDAGRTEMLPLADRQDRLGGGHSADRTRLLPPGGETEPRRRSTGRSVLLVGAPLAVVALLGLAYLVLSRPAGESAPAAVSAATPIPSTSAPTAAVAPAVATPVGSPAPAVAEAQPTPAPSPTQPPAPPTPTTALPTATRPPPTATPVPATPLPALASGPPGTVLLNETFDDLASGKLNRSRYDGGEYVVRTFGLQPGGGDLLPWDLPNVSIAVDVRIQGDTNNTQAGISCRASVIQGSSVVGVGRYSLFVRPGTRRAYVRALYEGKELRRVPEQIDHELPAVRPGSETNHLELDCAGDTITGRVNGHEIGAFKDVNISNGKVAFEVSQTTILGNPAAAEVRFDNLVLTQR